MFGFAMVWVIVIRIVRLVDAIEHAYHESRI